MCSLSLPPRGAWIEIATGKPRCPVKVPSLPPRGAWIEIMYKIVKAMEEVGRSPHGERGLKYDNRRHRDNSHQVAPPTGSVD